MRNVQIQNSAGPSSARINGNYSLFVFFLYDCDPSYTGFQLVCTSNWDRLLNVPSEVRSTDCDKCCLTSVFVRRSYKPLN